MLSWPFRAEHGSVPDISVMGMLPHCFARPVNGMLTAVRKRDKIATIESVEK